MPKAAVRFIFSKAQTERIQSFFPEFAAHVEQHDPNHEGRNLKITSWKKDKAKVLLQEPLFCDLDEAETQESWQTASIFSVAIIRLYSNYFNAHIKKNRLPVGVKKETATKDSRSRALVLFTGSVSPKALFAIENHHRITDLYKQISAEKGIPGGPAKSEAITQLWEREDQQIWEEKARTLSNDIEGNRAEFSDLILESMQHIIETGALGSCVLSLSYAFRGNDNEVFGGQVQAGFNSVSGSAVVQDFEEGEEAKKNWLEYARIALPRKAPVISTPLLRNADGLPLFPVFNRKTKTFMDMAQILEDYFRALWDHTQEGSLAIPWDDIGAHPDHYYDSWAHTLPCRLALPENMDDVDLTHLVVYLANKSTSKPFTFFSKSEVTKNITLAKDLGLFENRSKAVAAVAPSVPIPSREHTPFVAENVEPNSSREHTPFAPENVDPTCSREHTPFAPENVDPPILPPGASFEAPISLGNSITLDSELEGQAKTQLATLAPSTSAEANPPVETKKRKKCAQTVTDTVSGPSSVGTAASGTRRGVRSRKQAVLGPVLVQDPALPPPKRVK